MLDRLNTPPSPSPRSIRRLEVKLDRFAQAVRLDLANHDRCAADRGPKPDSDPGHEILVFRRRAACTSTASDVSRDEKGCSGSSDGLGAGLTRTNGPVECSAGIEPTRTTALESPEVNPAEGSAPEAGGAAHGVATGCCCGGRLGELRMQLERVAGALGVDNNASAREEQVLSPTLSIGELCGCKCTDLGLL